MICGDNDSRFPNGRSYTSAMLSTKGKASWHQGRFEARMKLPLAAGKSKGLWPAFWMRPADGTGDGELDIMEAIGTGDPADAEAGSVHQTLWYDGKGTYPKQSQVAPVPGGPAAGFHTYAAEWRPGVMRWYVDGKLSFERDGDHRAVDRRGVRRAVLPPAEPGGRRHLPRQPRLEHRTARRPGGGLGEGLPMAVTNS